MQCWGFSICCFISPKESSITTGKVLLDQSSFCKRLSGTIYVCLHLGSVSVQQHFHDFHNRLELLAVLGSLEGLVQLWALSDPWGLLKACGRCWDCTPGCSSFKYLFDGGYLPTQGECAWVCLFIWAGATPWKSDVLSRARLDSFCPRLVKFCICIYTILGQDNLEWGIGAVKRSTAAYRWWARPCDLECCSFGNTALAQGNCSLKSAGFELVPISLCLRDIWVCCCGSHNPIPNSKGVRRNLSLLTSYCAAACCLVVVFLLCSTEYQLLLSAGVAFVGPPDSHHGNGCESFWRGERKGRERSLCFAVNRAECWKSRIIGPCPAHTPCLAAAVTLCPGSLGCGFLLLALSITDLMLFLAPALWLFCFCFGNNELAIVLISSIKHKLFKNTSIMESRCGAQLPKHWSNIGVETLMGLGRPFHEIFFLVP